MNKYLLIVSSIVITFITLCFINPTIELNKYNIIKNSFKDQKINVSFQSCQLHLFPYPVIKVHDLNILTLNNTISFYSDIAYVTLPITQLFNLSNITKIKSVEFDNSQLELDDVNELMKINNYFAVDSIQLNNIEVYNSDYVIKLVDSKYKFKDKNNFSFISRVRINGLLNDITFTKNNKKINFQVSSNVGNLYFKSDNLIDGRVHLQLKDVSLIKNALTYVDYDENLPTNKNNKFNFIDISCHTAIEDNGIFLNNFISNNDIIKDISGFLSLNLVNDNVFLESSISIDQINFDEINISLDKPLLSLQDLLINYFQTPNFNVNLLSNLNAYLDIKISKIIMFNEIIQNINLSSEFVFGEMMLDNFIVTLPYDTTFSMSGITKSNNIRSKFIGQIAANSQNFNDFIHWFNNTTIQPGNRFYFYSDIETIAYVSKLQNAIITIDDTAVNFDTLVNNSVDNSIISINFIKNFLFSM